MSTDLADELDGGGDGLEEVVVEEGVARVPPHARERGRELVEDDARHRQNVLLFLVLCGCRFVLVFWGLEGVG